MNQQPELEKVKGWIRALAAKTTERGCSEAEALAAAKKVGELLEVYGLSMGEVELREEPCIQRKVTVSGTAFQALSTAFLGVVKLTETKGWTSGRDTMVFFGLEPDVLTGEYLLHVIAGALQHEEALYKASDAYRRSTVPTQARMRSFRYGFGSRVCGRLEQLAEERRTSEDTARLARAPAAQSQSMAAGAQEKPAGTSLVLVKQVVIEEAFKDLGVKLVSRSSYRRIRDGKAYSHGQAAGGRVGLNRPVGAGPGSGRIGAGR